MMSNGCGERRRNRPRTFPATLRARKKRKCRDCEASPHHSPQCHVTYLQNSNPIVSGCSIILPSSVLGMQPDNRVARRDR